MEAERTINYRINKKYKLKFGQSLYIVGSTVNLGNWDPLKAIRMNCFEEKYWTAEVTLPVSKIIQYKYFVGPTWRESLDKGSVQWVDPQNRILYFDSSNALHFTKENEKTLKIMSFNVRYENNKDINKYSWAERKTHVAQLILSYLPDFVGVQEPKTSQREYLNSIMGQFYQYFGKPRDLHRDEESGIFIRRDKFIVREDGYIWINENRKEGVKGYGSNLPRYFTYVLVSPLVSTSRLIMIINTHLDHQSQSSRLNGIKLISTVIKQTYQKYNSKVTNVFLTGDFNTSDNDHIFNHLIHTSHKLQSMRLVLPESQSDFGQTFNGFSKLTSVAERVAEFFKFSSIAKIDHIFQSSEDYQPIKFEVIRTNQHIISDHYPIMGTLLERN